MAKVGDLLFILGALVRRPSWHLQNRRKSWKYRTCGDDGLLKLTLYYDLLLRCLFLLCFVHTCFLDFSRLNDHQIHPGGLEVHTRTLDASGCWASSSIEFPWGDACIEKIKIRALFSKLASSAMRVFKHTARADLRTEFEWSEAYHGCCNCRRLRVRSLKVLFPMWNFRETTQIPFGGVLLDFGGAASR